MNYSEINLITYVTDLYTKNYKKVLREIKDLKKWRARTCLWIRTSKMFYQFSPSRSTESTRHQIPAVFLNKLRYILKLILKCKVLRRAKTILKKNKVGNLS